MDLYRSTLARRGAGEFDATNQLEMQRQMFNANLDADALKGKYRVFNPDGSISYRDIAADEGARQHDDKMAEMARQFNVEQANKFGMAKQQEGGQMDLAKMKLANDAHMFDKNVMGNFVSNALLQGASPGDVTRNASNMSQILRGVRAPVATGGGATTPAGPEGLGERLDVANAVPNAAQAILRPNDKGQLPVQDFLNRIGQQQQSLKLQGVPDAQAGTLLGETLKRGAGQYGNLNKDSLEQQYLHKLRYYGRPVPEANQTWLERLGSNIGLGSLNQTAAGRVRSILDPRGFQADSQELNVLADLLNQFNKQGPRRTQFPSAGDE